MMCGATGVGDTACHCSAALSTTTPVAVKAVAATIRRFRKVHTKLCKLGSSSKTPGWKYVANDALAKYLHDPTPSLIGEYMTCCHFGDDMSCTCNHTCCMNHAAYAYRGQERGMGNKQRNFAFLCLLGNILRIFPFLCPRLKYTHAGFE